jgi:hypothetical protein
MKSQCKTFIHVKRQFYCTVHTREKGMDDQMETTLTLNPSWELQQNMSEPVDSLCIISCDHVQLFPRLVHAYSIMIIRWLLYSDYILYSSIWGRFT